MNRQTRLYICVASVGLLMLTLHACGGHGHHHSFDDAEKWASRWNTPERDVWQKPDAVLKAMDLKTGLTVADLGTGTGYFLPYLAEAVGAQGKVFALDVEPAMIAFVKKRVTHESALSNVEPRQVPLDAPGLEEESVDRVLIVNTWHHIGQRRDYSMKLSKALKPGGAVVVVDFKQGTDIPGAPEHMRLAPSVVIAELASGGLEAELVPAGLPRQYVIVARKP